MKPIMFVLFVTVIGLTSCKEKNKTSGKDAEGQQVAELVQDSARDSLEIRRVITDFYNWYDKNYAKFQEYDLYSGIKKKDAPPYKINWDEVDKYQQFIRDSVPQLGEEFLARQKHFFEQCDSAFKKDLKDEIPYGFDYDWYTNSQEETKYTTDRVNANKAWSIKIEGDYAKVNIGDSPQDQDSGLQIHMKKEKGKWTIANIGTYIDLL